MTPEESLQSRSAEGGTHARSYVARRAMHVMRRVYVVTTGAYVLASITGVFCRDGRTR